MKAPLAIAALTIGVLYLVTRSDEPTGGITEANLSGVTGGATTVIDAAVVEGCVVCHKDQLSLAEWSTTDLAAEISRIIAGESQHVVPIPSLGEDEIGELAAALAAD